MPTESKEINFHKKTSTGEDKHYYFISGLPRSGSTLLCNILNQNPRFHATSTSGVLDMLLAIRNNWNNIVEFKATRNEFAKIRVLRGMLESFYADVDKPIIFDKSRGWLGFLEMAENLIGNKAKILVPVRDIREVLSSFEKLWRKESVSGQISQEKQNPLEFQTVEGRCETFLKINQPVGSAYNRIKDALHRGYGDRMHFIFFDELTENPKATIDAVYAFLGEKPFAHDFDNIEQTTHEDDFFHGFKDLHTIRKQVLPVPPDWREVLGGWAERYEKLNFWDTYRKRKGNTK
ncbi:MAG: sulfotransferase [Candidatus Taylorbacteria bacterium]